MIKFLILFYQKQSDISKPKTLILIILIQNTEGASKRKITLYQSIKSLSLPMIFPLFQVLCCEQKGNK